ncbi:four helix bundle protein [bacterium]|nr:four helix bundle protein [bacterium]
MVTGHAQGTPQGSWSDQTYRSATSVSANIAEGVGRMQRSQVIQFLRVARGSAFETISHLSLSPIAELDLAALRKSYVALIEAIDTSLARLIDP